MHSVYERATFDSEEYQVAYEVIRFAMERVPDQYEDPLMSLRNVLHKAEFFVSEELDQLPEQAAELGLDKWMFKKYHVKKTYYVRHVETFEVEAHNEEAALEAWDRGEAELVHEEQMECPGDRGDDFDLDVGLPEEAQPMEAPTEGMKWQRTVSKTDRGDYMTYNTGLFKIEGHRNDYRLWHKNTEMGHYRRLSDAKYKAESIKANEQGGDE